MNASVRYSLTTINPLKIALKVINLTTFHLFYIQRNMKPIRSNIRRVTFADEHNYLSPANDNDAIFDSDNIYDDPYAPSHR